ncbi:hypothetical protein CPAR01_07749 [Colletotrichum paranaense]|uniref:Uncharacterized protein n=1 Tax=Colletotrichum paranaense TaxID=1914294 RepID=A0ABQ9SIB5_9PEZI|nr:uncharacterized protein CPAR01_07749 [Colletotrichum paranaense]KAK1537636.1 hypothetical protein CPAR01_07749 [Colletotrichum paranaense]
MSTALVQPPTPNHTLSVGTMTECLFSFASSRANVPFTTTPLYEGGGGACYHMPRPWHLSQAQASKLFETLRISKFTSLPAVSL